MTDTNNPSKGTPASRIIGVVLMVAGIGTMLAAGIADSHAEAMNLFQWIGSLLFMVGFGAFFIGIFILQMTNPQNRKSK